MDKSDETFDPTHPSVVAGALDRLADKFGAGYQFSLTDTGAAWALIHDDPTVSVLHNGVDGVEAEDFEALVAAVRSVRDTNGEDG